MIVLRNSWQVCGFGKLSIISFILIKKLPRGDFYYCHRFMLHVLFTCSIWYTRCIVLLQTNVLLAYSASELYIVSMKNNG